MCGIAGMIDLTGRRQPVPSCCGRWPARSHRGPDEDGFLTARASASPTAGSRIVGLADGRQPISNEDGVRLRRLQRRAVRLPRAQGRAGGPRPPFRTHCDTELLAAPVGGPRRGDVRPSCAASSPSPCGTAASAHVVLARDRFGICPLYWTQQGDWLLFASEIKALLASGMVRRDADPRGINHLFTFFALPGPAHLLRGRRSRCRRATSSRSQLGRDGKRHRVERAHATGRSTSPTPATRTIPADRGAAGRRASRRRSSGAVERRLRADVPVVAYLSGGVDSSYVVATGLARLRARRSRRSPSASRPGLRRDRTRPSQIARHVGADPTVVTMRRRRGRLRHLPDADRRRRGPGVDTSCAALCCWRARSTTRATRSR